MTDGGGGDGGRFAIEESLGYQVNYLAKAFARELAARLAPHGVSPRSGGCWCSFGPRTASRRPS
jgi:hypothetical protein